jgi:transcriptional regulator with XRE-family HTH domain
MKKLKNARKSMGLNRPDFGLKIGRSGRMVAFYEDGKVIPPPDIQAKIYEITKGAVTPNDWHGIQAGGKRK